MSLANDVLSNILAQERTDIAPLPQPGIDIEGIIGQINQKYGPTTPQEMDWFVDSGQFAREWHNEDGTNINIPREQMWTDLSNKKMKEYMKLVGEEALRADFNLLPGLGVLAHEASYEVPKKMPRGLFIWSELYNKAKAGTLDLTAPEGRTMGPWGLGVDALRWAGKIAGQALPEPEPEIGLTRGKGTDELPLSYRIMKPYFKAYEEMVDAEAEWMVTRSRATGEDISLGMGLSAATPHLGANVAMAAADPAGRVARFTARTIGWGVKGLILGATALGGARGAEAMLKGTAKGNRLATTKFGKTLELLAGVGRGAHPAVDGKAVAEAAAYASARYDDSVRRMAGLTPGAEKEVVLEKIVEDVRKFLDKPSIGAPKYLEEKQVGMIADAIVYDATHEAKPFAQSNARMVADTVFQGGFTKAAIPPRTEIIKSTRKAVRDLKAADSRLTDGMVRAEAELERLLPVAEKDPHARRWRISSLFDPIWKFNGSSREAHRIAGRYVHNQQDYLFDTAVAYHRMKEEIPDKAVRQDMIAYIEGTGNPWQGSHDTHALVTQRLRNSPYWDKVEEHTKHIRERFDSLWREMNELNAQIGDENVAYLDNWMHHMWVEPGQQAQQKLGHGYRYQVTPVGSAERPRTIPTYFEGMHALNHPLTPRTDDIAHLYALTEAEAARVLATKKLIVDLNEMGLLESGEHAFLRLPKGVPVPDHYVPFKSAFTDRLLTENLSRAERAKTNLYVHEEVGRHFRNIIKQPLESSALDKVSAIAKRSNFFWTLFHGYSLAESSMALLGVKGTQANYGLLKSLVTKRKGWADYSDLNWLVAPENFREAFTRASEAGVMLSPPIHDTMIDEFEKVAKRVALAVDRNVPGKAKPADKILNKMLNSQGWFDTKLWGRYHTPMKVIAYDMMFENLKGLRDGTLRGINPLNRGLRQMDDEALSRAVAEFINDEFGSQNMVNHTKGWVMNFLSDPDNLKKLNFAFTSVDWNTSAVRASLGAAQAIPGMRFSNPAKGIMGIRHWRNALMGWAFYANILNKALSGQYIWENEPGRKLYYIDTGVRDENGKPIYIHIGKQFREIGGAVGINLQLQQKRGGWHGMGVDVDFSPSQDFTARKIMPWLQGFVNPDDYDYTMMQLLREGKELGLSTTVLSQLQHNLRNFSPFALGALSNPALEDVEFGLDKMVLMGLGTMLPIARGPADSVHIANMAEAIRDGNIQRLDQISMDLAHSRGEQYAGTLLNEAHRLARENPTGGRLEPDGQPRLLSRLGSRLKRVLMGEY